ncbi:NADPH oxidase activator 1 isoform X1 [Phycodurus eques]|uniref:NADPH oxidase activator 1 isoform X1 n=3 Tax=Phycodurus eques TaxID=693459 RepID=UPI002ACDF6D7|nr:NADPH oxidase activator 1 isoform X1 [Phycodurus eques]XP_061529134.1 NADPH oxidase activator 1 isoform X1 [Phycodurus eques]
MLYTELLQLWNESVHAMDNKDWQGALEKLEQITEPTSHTLFNAASAHLCLGQLDSALKALDLTIVKDQRLSVAFFQRAAVMIQLDRLEEALSDCVWAQKHLRGNMVIDYRQLGLRYKLYSWQVLHNAAAVYCRMDQWEQARDILLSESQGGNLEMALDSILREEIFAPLLVPEGVVFRPRKKDVEQLKQRDFLGKAKVISSMIPNDDFGGFEPLRLQKPGYYQPKVDGAQESRYMCLAVPYMARGPGQLTVPGGSKVFLFEDQDKDGMATVIYDGQRGLVPMSLLKPANIKMTKGKTENTLPTGIPLPPGLKPPARPQKWSRSAAPTLGGQLSSDIAPPSYSSATHTQLPPPEPPNYTADSASNKDDNSVQEAETDSVVVKVHYTYTVALSVPSTISYHELKEDIAQQLDQPASSLRLRHKKHGSRLLVPLEWELEAGRTIQEVSEAGRTTLWCQVEDSLRNHTIRYQMVALYDYSAQGPEDLEFSEGDTIDILGEVNEEWLEGHCAGNIGIFPSSFAMRENENFM